MKLLFVPAREAVPSTREMVSAWAMWLPVAAACVYLGWGYGRPEAEATMMRGAVSAILVLVAIGTMVRPVMRTWRWLKGEAD